jgi:alkylation response protein AidB-like acyl-CoA dehydrogenase
VGALRTKAVPSPEGDGSWRITGQKIFITYGDHDLTENIVHLVLARVPDAPPGTKGISCFIVPKHILEDDGTPGAHNAVRCIGIEHKLGIHGSPTCVLEFDGATGYLIGEPNAGMQYMFTMMNTARLSVGLSGLAVSEAAYQQALAYAQERKQGRALGAPAGTSSPIVEHADVRRMLLTMRSTIEAMRGVLYLNAEAIDHARQADTPEARAAADELADLLTPISKGWCTDVGNELTSIAVQVHGGMGYIEETGIAQRYRDMRIAAIYEGTNGIQALDLVGRKLPLRGGVVIADLLTRMEGVVAELASAGDELASMRANLAAAIESVRDTTAWLLSALASDPNEAFAGASPYARQLGLTVGGWVLARQALAARAAGLDDPYNAAKLTTARFYCEQLLPQAAGLVSAVKAGKDVLFAIAPDQLKS